MEVINTEQEIKGLVRGRISYDWAMRPEIIHFTFVFPKNLTTRAISMTLKYYTYVFLGLKMIYLDEYCSLRREYPPITLSRLQTLIDTGRLDNSKPIDLAALCNTKLFTLIPDQNHYGFQLTDEGLDNFKAKVNIEVQWAPEQVIAAVERNGGVITTAFYDMNSLWALRDPLKFFKKGKRFIK